MLLEGVLNAGELERLNQAFDEHSDATGSNRFRGYLAWDESYRRLLDHPGVLPYLKEWIDPAVHLGRHHHTEVSVRCQVLFTAYLGGTPHVRPAYYQVHDGRIFSGLTVVSWALRDMPAGQGTFACIPGSHKSELHWTTSSSSPVTRVCRRGPDEGR